MPTFHSRRLRRDLAEALDARWRRLVPPEGHATGEAEEALAEARDLLRPAFAYAIYPVVGAAPDALLVGDGHRLASPVVARLFAPARQVVLLTYTVGPRLEARVADYRARGDAVRAVTLDVLASLAVDDLGRFALDHVKQLASARGVRASIPFNPGTSHWPLGDLKLFLELIPAAEIGLALGDDGLLRPIKSISMAIALGEDVPTDAEASSCDYCDHPEFCHEPERKLAALLSGNDPSLPDA